MGARWATVFPRPQLTSDSSRQDVLLTVLAIIVPHVPKLPTEYMNRLSSSVRGDQTEDSCGMSQVSTEHVVLKG